jgi:acyl-CoA thioester hydrolase
VHKNHLLSINVYYEDTDAGGFVYHSKYLNYAERARTEMIKKGGLTHNLLREKYDCLCVVSNLEIKYKKPALLDDHLVVDTRITQIRGAQIHFQQTIFRKEEVLTELVVSVACINTAGRPIKVPACLREL